MLPIFGMMLSVSIFRSQKRARWFLSAAVAFITASFPPSAEAAQATLGADKDNSIFASHVNNSLGGGPAFFSGTNANNSARRALLSFDLSSIPSGAVVTDVQLTLTLAQVSGSNPPGMATIGLFDLAQSWGEGTAGSTSLGVGGTGNGFTASAGDATWNAATSGSTPWGAAGGDHAAAASASLTLVGTTPGTAYTWLSTPQLVADVQGWLNNPATNFGWELINANESTANSLYGFYSSEWHTFAGGLASQEPVLQVTYSVPEPRVAALGALAGFVCLLRRHRHAAKT
jgi:hypothetical protein